MAVVESLPEGFVLDQAESNNSLPEGFVLDTAKTSQPSWLSENVGRPIARAARTSLAGAASLTDPINQALGLPLAEKSVESAFDTATTGLAKPRNKTEEYVDSAGKLLASGGGISKIVNAVAKKAVNVAPTVGNAIANKAKELFSINSPEKLNALAGASLAIPAAQEATNKALDIANVSPDSGFRTGANVVTSLLAGVAGGKAGASATNIPVNIKNFRTLSSLPEGQADRFGRSKVANQVVKDLQTKGISPQEVDAELQGNAGLGLDPIDVSKANVSNIPELAQIAASRKILKNSFDAREQKIITAQNQILKGVQGDENALTQLSEAYVEKLSKKMQTTAKPLYEDSFSKAPAEIPLESSIVNKDGDQINLGDVISRPDIKEALKKSRAAAKNAEGTSAAKFYQKAAGDLPNNNPIVLHNLQSYLRRNSGKLDKFIPDVDEASIMAKRGDILQFLDDNLPGYKDARSIYSADVEDLMRAKKSTTGIIANLQSDKGAEAMNKLYKLSPAEISKTKVQLMAIDANKYASAVKSFTDQKIGTLREGQTIASLIKNPQEKAKLRAMFPNSKTFDGFEKAVTYIEKTKPVQDVLKRALDQEIRSTSLAESIPQKEGLGKKALNAPARTIKKGRELTGLSEAPSVKTVDSKQAETMANYAFTDEGRQLFQQLAKTTKKADIDKIMTQIYLQSGFLTTLSNSSENPKK